MSITLLSASQLEELRHYNTPTISNAIELFDVRPRHVGFLPHQIRCLLPNLGVIVGYAVTAKTSAVPPTEVTPDLLDGYLNYVAAQPGPKIAIGQDIDNPPGLGAQFGEVTAAIHKKLGCVGHITDGCPRDLDEVEALGFQLFGLNPCVSHAYVRLVDFGKPVHLAGVEIKPGDLIHADKHGVCLIPHDVAPRLALACKEVERIERPVLDACKKEPFDLNHYLQLRKAMKPEMHE
ncbi:RraA family protein [Singulisphaera sp. PoT]|uniref:RraA family protein n=1 Tax=Singulisphaera sp. PoT TaxID=3411797 RepID=UPI003BF46EF4